MTEDGRKYQIGDKVTVMRPVEFVVEQVYYSEDAPTGERSNFSYRLSEDVVVAEGEIVSGAI